MSAATARRLTSRESLASDNALLLAIAGVSFLVHALIGGNYGYFRDELYYIAAGRHPGLRLCRFPPMIAVDRRRPQCDRGRQPRRDPPCVGAGRGGADLRHGADGARAGRRTLRAGARRDRLGGGGGLHGDRIDLLDGCAGRAVVGARRICGDPPAEARSAATVAGLWADRRVGTLHEADDALLWLRAGGGAAGDAGAQVFSVVGDLCGWGHRVCLSAAVHHLERGEWLADAGVLEQLRRTAQRWAARLSRQPDPACQSAVAAAVDRGAGTFTCGARRAGRIARWGGRMSR